MVDSVVINEHSDSSRDQWINEGITEESAEVSMTKEGAVKEPTAILHIPACGDENESANAADSWGIGMTVSRYWGCDAAHVTGSHQSSVSLL